MNNKNSDYRQKLNEVIIEKRQELEHRKNRLNNNIFVEICQKSIIAQRKTILYLEIQINNLEIQIFTKSSVYVSLVSVCCSISSSFISSTLISGRLSWLFSSFSSKLK